MQSVPSIMDGHFLLDTGRITPRWRWEENPGCSAVRIVGASVLPFSTV